MARTLPLGLFLALATLSAPTIAQSAPLHSAAIPFDFANHDIKSSARTLLDGVAARLLSNSHQAHITGLADDTFDNEQEVRRLSLRRAVAVRNYLLEKGIAANRLRVFARGDVGEGNIGAKVDILSAP